MEPNFDLFGQPVREGFGKRGRPPYMPTEKDRNKVKLLLALGWAPLRVANALGVSEKTVRRYFSPELKAWDAMRDRLDARRIEVTAEQAFDGNMTAMKLLGEMIDRNDRMEIERRMGEQKKSDEPANQRPGKKVIDEMRAAAADEDLMAELESEARNAGLHS